MSESVKMRALGPVSISAVGTVAKGDTFAVSPEVAEQLEKHPNGPLAERMDTSNEPAPAEGDAGAQADTQAGAEGVSDAEGGEGNDSLIAGPDRAAGEGADSIPTV